MTNRRSNNSHPIKYELMNILIRGPFNVTQGDPKIGRPTSPNPRWMHRGRFIWGKFGVGHFDF